MRGRRLQARFAAKFFKPLENAPWKRSAKRLILGYWLRDSRTDLFFPRPSGVRSGLKEEPQGSDVGLRTKSPIRWQ